MKTYIVVALDHTVIIGNSKFAFLLTVIFQEGFFPFSPRAVFSTNEIFKEVI